MAKVKFTDELVKKLIRKFAVENAKPKPSPRVKQVNYHEKQGAGRSGSTLTLSLSYGGSCTWRSVYYVSGRPHSKKLGYYPSMTLQQARTACKTFKAPQNVAEKPVTLRTACEDWLVNRVEKGNLRTAAELRRHCTRYIFASRVADMPIADVRRGHIAEILDSIDAPRREHSTRRSQGGRSQADSVLLTLSSVMRWYHNNRDERYQPIITAAMRRDQRKDRSRDRVLSDDEIRLLWHHTEAPTMFNAFVRVLLLSGQRYEKVHTMKHTDVTDGVWHISVFDRDREKGTAGRLTLPQAALAAIAALPVIDNNRFVFAGANGGPATNFHRSRKKLIAKMRAENFTFHDLRRTWRTVASKAGVDYRVTEQVLGHTIKGVEKFYNRHSYDLEKDDAVERVARLIKSIVEPSPAKVIPIRAALKAEAV